MLYFLSFLWDAACVCFFVIAAMRGHEGAKKSVFTIWRGRARVGGIWHLEWDDEFKV